MLHRLRTLAARSHPRRQPPERVAAALVSLLAGVAVYAVATGVFPHLSLNHDEAVYLQQAALLLEGQLSVHAGELADAVRPWFFVQDGGRLYPKYQPYPAALYALAIGTVGQARVALAGVAAANAALVYALGATAFDRRVGVLAAAAFAASPMALVTTATFLPYAPTATLTLAFALLYLRALGTGRARTAALAGGAIGLAFLARPYTAVLFAAPFVAHAGWQVLAAIRECRGDLLAGLRRRDHGALPAPIRRNVATAAVGLAFVALALAYNARVTGSPLRFPYAAFAPQDGPGFGHREILAHSVEYTPELAVRSNALVVRELLLRWGPAGAVGSALALAGLALAARRWRRGEAWAAGADRTRGAGADQSAGAEADEGAGANADEGAATNADEGAATNADEGAATNADEGAATETHQAPAAEADEQADERGAGAHTDRTAQVLLAGLFLSVPLGNVAFWGNYNVLGGTADPTDGLLGHFGPFYHFDLLAPLAVFAAATAVAAWRWASAARDGAGASSEDGDGAAGARFLATLPGIDRRRSGAAALAALLLLGLLAGAANAALAAGALERNAAHTQELDRAYEPFDERALADAVVFLPTPYGDWLAHPFQRLRNDPDLDGEVVYALDRGPASDFAVVDAYPNRSVHRYSYRGEWPPDGPDSLVPTLERLEVRSGERLRGETTVGVPEGAEHAAVRLETDDGEHADYEVQRPGDAVTVAWSLDADGARLRRPDGTASEPLAVANASEVVLQMRLDDGRGGSLTYRQVATVRTSGERVEALWPPERTVCALVDVCGREGTYLPDHPEEHRDGVAFETELAADGA